MHAGDAYDNLVVLRMAGGEDVERNWFLDHISLIKSSNPFLLCHSAGIASRTRVLFVDCSTFMSPPTVHTHPWRSRTSCYIWQSCIQGHMCNKIALIGILRRKKEEETLFVNGIVTVGAV